MNRTTRMIAAMILAAGFHATAATVARAQSVTGKWDGTATTQQGAQSVSVTLDSTAAGWKGTVTSDMAGTAELFGIAMKSDTVSFSLSMQNATIAMQGVLSADRKTMNGWIWVEGNEAGTFKLTHAPAAAPKPPQLH